MDITRTTIVKKKNDYVSNNKTFSHKNIPCK